MRTAHHVRRQRWRVRTAQQEQAFALHARLRRAWDVFAPVFEQHFDRIAPDRTLHIPELRIELRIPAAAALEDIAPMLIDEQLRAALEPWLENVMNAEDAVTPDAHVADLQILERYLEYGELHWSLLGSDVTPDERITFLRALAVAALPQAFAAARRAPAAAGLFRLLQLLIDISEQQLSAMLAPHVPAEMRVIVTALLAGEHAAALPRHIRIQLAAALLGMPDASGKTDRAIVQTWRPLLGALPTSDLAAVEQIMKAASPELHEMLSLEISPKADSLAALEVARTPASATSDNNTTSLKSEESASDAPDRVVLHAGIVLLHPYLARLFQQCGLLRDQELPPARHARAAALLHFLATGGTEVHEFELPLIKLLLGIDPDEPLPVASGLLRDVDMEEADALLHAVIEHWPVLRNTSIATLRSEFLQRSGLLARSEFGWRLRVQPAAFDALLNHLPWPISLIRLPWQTSTLEVEWPTP